ncbi:MAG: aldo/keto reductase [Cyanobacteria bacterium J06621_12]
MRYRRFGQTKLKLSVFSLGTMRCLDDSQTYLQTIAKAIARGINHLETARGYGQSEIYLGQALKDLEIPRQDIYLTTKLPPTPNASEMTEWLDESLSRLQTDYIDCLALHGINTWEHLEWVTRPNGCLAAIRGAMAQRKVKHLGFSTHGSLELILEAINTNIFEFVNLHYYYFFQRHQQAIALAAEKDMGIFIISPADKGGQLHTPSDKLESLCAPFTPLEINYRFLLSDRRITTLSLGAANPDELNNPLQVADAVHSLTDTEQAVLEKLELELTASLATNLCSQCYQCLPCPEQINIPEILRLRNLTVAYEMSDYGQYRYGMLENAGHWFPGMKGNKCTDCGDCLPRCPENLDIPHLLRDTHQRLKGKQRRRLWSD